MGLSSRHSSMTSMSFALNTQRLCITPCSVSGLNGIRGCRSGKEACFKNVVRAPCKTSTISCAAAFDANVIGDLAVSVPLLEPLVFGVLLIGGFVAYRVWAYSQLEYITAAMLSKYVIKGGARVIQFGGGTRELYYYPKGTVQVTVVGDKVEQGLMQQAGIQAQIPVVVNDKPAGVADLGAGSSADAIVLIRTLSSISNIGAFLQEVCRVLKPGAPLIFIERVAGDGFGSVLQSLSGGASSAVGLDVLNKVKSFDGFEEVNWDVALGALDPHAVGIASKSEVTSEPQLQRKKKKKTKQNRTGFS